MIVVLWCWRLRLVEGMRCWSTLRRSGGLSMEMESMPAVMAYGAEPRRSGSTTATFKAKAPEAKPAQKSATSCSPSP